MNVSSPTMIEAKATPSTVVLGNLLATAWLIRCVSAPPRLCPVTKTWRGRRRATSARMESRSLAKMLYTPCFGLGMVLVCFFRVGKNVWMGIVGAVLVVNA